MRRRSILAAATAVASAGTPAIAQQRQLVVGIPAFPDSLTPGFSSFTSLTMSFQTMDPMFLRDEDGKVIPGLATEWRAADDRTWRFRLRENVRFHDGTPFTAEDVKGTIDYVLDPRSVYGTRNRIAGIESVSIIGPHEVEVRTAAPFPTLINGLSDIPIESQHYRTSGPAGRPPMGTGPWRYARWVAGDRYELTANADYWGGAPRIERLLLRQIPEASTRVASLLAGETHIIQEVPIDLIPRVRNSRAAEIASVETSVGLVLTFDATKPPFNDRRVRLAMDYAVDRQQILDQILGGQGSLLQGQLLTANTFGFNPNIRPRPYDPAMARRLLAEAGYPRGFTTTIATRSGRYLSDVDITNALVGMFQEVGVRATVNVMEGGVWARQATAGDMGPAHLVGWFSLGDADFATVWFTRGGQRAFWSNEEYERLFVEARSTVDESRRLAAYHRMMEILNEEAPSVFLFGLPSINGKSRRLTGWRPSSDTILRLTRAELN
ncbi:ABC transporter substrate-binding protein [Falsiroseomonas sp. HW251]|uniref:ABC transporter substrate-binding protein n=1 Tax=Falsiroseomonas sp. HW251 TaxID=3390998 RepID=UPI003D3122C9